MEWQVTLDSDVKKIKLPEGSTANDLVNHLELHPDGVLIVTDEEKMKPIPLILKLPDKPIRIILVASGG